MSEHVLILGANSGIARAVCDVLAERGVSLLLAGRQLDELEKTAADLRIRFKADVHCEMFEALDYASHPAFVTRAVERCGGRIDGVVLCYGNLPDQRATEQDFTLVQRTIDVNFTSVVSILNLLATVMEKQGSGTIAAISSVAGDRGRQSNYTYGAAKAGLTAYLQGLRNRLAKRGVHVLTIKPGFVDTAMTKGIIPATSPLLASPQRVARDIDRAMRRRHNTLYTPWFWWPIMTIICSIPEAIFKRLKL